MKKIDWEYWSSQSKGVRLWELVALSLNINPTDIEKKDGLYKKGHFDWDRLQYVASSQPIFIFHGRYPKKVKDSFFERLDQKNYDQIVADVSNIEIGETIRLWNEWDNEWDNEIIPVELKRISGIKT